MAQFHRRYRGAQRWGQLRYQFASTLLLAAAVPYLSRYVTVSAPHLLAALTVTLVANALAVMLGIWLFRSVSNYPGVEASSYILPSYSIAYALALLVLLFGRFEYNRGTLIAGYTISVLWSYFIYSRMQRRRLVIGYVPLGAISTLHLLDKIDWVELKDPGFSIRHADAVAADLRADLPEQWERRLADYALQGVPVYHFKHIAESLIGRVELEHLSENNFGSLTPGVAYMSVKHTIDWIAALLALIVLAPFLLTLLALIRLDSPGPAVFRQRRIGYQGQPFTVFKFRTMTVAADQPDDARSAAMTRHADERVTRIGELLRRTRLDEIPQLVNVLRGEMSWIGPRPEADVLSTWYEREIAFYRYRHIVRPGITGWAQVQQGHVADVEDVRSKLHYDFFYIKNFSPWIDLLIVARTISTMLTGFGSR